MKKIKKEIKDQMVKENEDNIQRQVAIKSFLEARIKAGDEYQLDGQPREKVKEMAERNIKEIELFLEHLRKL